ncbi:deoxynucleoside triphosphate triphosphohydrolase SAMHD1-like [Macrosteles quadrilineatus]|uniref:deoxynucleoside triphosphate triphosphohydrolase SAMHD1-like n=1 Tax=Macrosteles quadrilineatus TaxID=74068 RepID=UPI0023E2D5E6|nr:deoxynucleoside triphosphate triphosphohydrolase SAMHD1-like [Macrosteles quadrilineatus]
MNINNGCRNGDLREVCSSAMEATGYKVFNDSVHGHITLHPLLVRVVDTPQFQRLRNIKQLGPANYVFPGASNCRYEHSLGTCYLAGQMVEKLLEREHRSRTAEERQRLTLCVQLAALCHDLGHGPFSHTWEQVTQRWGDPWKHEEASVAMFDSLVESNDLVGIFSDHGLKQLERRIIKELIMGGPPDGNPPLLGPEDNFLYQIVSNRETGIDVDKWDYFLRDGLHLNLSITFNYRRLLEFCTVVTLPSDGRTHIAFRDKEIMNLYDMFRTRSALHHTAYKHRVVLNVELMTVDGFVAAGEAGYKINNSEILLKDAHKRPESLCEMTDHLFFDILYTRDPKLSSAQTTFKRIFQRKLYKFVEKINIQIQGGTVKERQSCVKEKKAELIKKLADSCPNYEFGIGEFYLDLDCHNDPVSKVHFYTKLRDSNAIKIEAYQKIRDLLDPFPFQLTREPTAVLSVFCKTENVTDEDLADAKTMILSVGLSTNTQP